jgi:ABC-type amino acid transport substrate-binding protein
LLDYHIDVAIADSSSAHYFTQTSGYCELEVTGIPFGKMYFGIALPKEWPYKEDLDDHIMELKLNGEIDRLLAKLVSTKKL